MFLLQIKNLRLKSPKLKKIESLKKLLNQLEENREILLNLRKQDIAVKFNDPTYFKNFSEQLPGIYFVIGFVALQKNTYLYVRDYKSKTLLSISAGNLGLKGFQKIKKPFVIIKMLRYLFKHEVFSLVIRSNIIALHCKNLNKTLIKFISLMLQKKGVAISSLRSFNSRPHNGCRPRKIKRRKRKKLRFY